MESRDRIGYSIRYRGGKRMIRDNYHDRTTGRTNSSNWRIHRPSSSIEILKRSMPAMPHLPNEHNARGEVVKQANTRIGGEEASPAAIALVLDETLERTSQVREDLLKDMSPVWNDILNASRHQQVVGLSSSSYTSERIAPSEQTLSILVDLLCRPSRQLKRTIISQLPQKLTGLTRTDISRLLDAVKGDHFALEVTSDDTLSRDEINGMNDFDSLIDSIIGSQRKPQRRSREVDNLVDAPSGEKRQRIMQLNETEVLGITDYKSCPDSPNDKCGQTTIHVRDSESAYAQQCRVWNDETQLNRLRNIWAAADKESHLHVLSEQVEHIRRCGRPARPYTKARHGPSEFTVEEADYALFDEDEYIEWQEENHPRFSTLPVVVRDPSTVKYHRGEPTSEWFKRMRKELDTRIQVQTFSRTLDEISASDISIAELDERWHCYTLDPDEQIANNFPLNCLNIQDSTPNMRPFGLCTERFRLMTHACDAARRLIPPENLKKLEIPIETIRTPAAGKKVVRELTSAKSARTITLQSSDIENCEDFLIMAQAGSVSGWHIDQCGVFTYVRILPATPYQTNDEDVVKLWPFLNMHDLTTGEVNSLREGFGEHGDGWNPTPSNRIAGLSLFTHDTLVQPPGTIHAPITMTQCSGRGGMVMDYGSLKESIATWKWLADHNNCSNEDLPKQTFAVLKAILRLVGDISYEQGEIEEGVVQEPDSQIGKDVSLGTNAAISQNLNVKGHAEVKDAQNIAKSTGVLSSELPTNDAETPLQHPIQDSVHPLQIHPSTSLIDDLVYYSTLDENSGNVATNIAASTNRQSMQVQPTQHSNQQTSGTTYIDTSTPMLSPGSQARIPSHKQQIPPHSSLSADIKYIAQRITSCACSTKGCMKNCRCKGFGIPCGVRCRCCKGDKNCVHNAWVED